MNKLIITEDGSGANPFFTGQEPDIISLVKKPNLTHGLLGKSYKFGSHQIDCLKEYLEKDKEISFVLPFYVKLNERGRVSGISVEEYSNKWDTGLGGFFVYSSKKLKEVFEFQRVSRKRHFSKKRNDIIKDYIEEITLEYNYFLENNIYHVLLEENGVIVNSVESITGSSQEEIFDKACKELDLNKKDFILETVNCF